MSFFFESFFEPFFFPSDWKEHATPDPRDACRRFERQQAAAAEGGQKRDRLGRLGRWPYAYGSGRFRSCGMSSKDAKGTASWIEAVPCLYEKRFKLVMTEMGLYVRING